MKAMTHMQRLALATLRQNTGRAYPALEARLGSMTDAELQDFLRLIRDLQDDAKRQAQRHRFLP